MAPVPALPRTGIAYAKAQARSFTEIDSRQAQLPPPPALHQSRLFGAERMLIAYLHCSITSTTRTHLTVACQRRHCGPTLGARAAAMS